MKKVVKYPVEPVQKCQVDDGHFGAWYFDLEVFDREPSNAELFVIGKRDRQAYEAGDLLPVRIKVFACVEDGGSQCAVANTWLTPREMVERSYVERSEVRQAMRESITVTLEWMATVLGRIGMGEAKHELERAMGMR